MLLLLPAAMGYLFSWPFMVLAHGDLLPNNLNLPTYYNIFRCVPA
jgi:hypothetical protein